MNSNPFIVRQPMLPPSSNVTEQFLRDVGHDHAILHELYQYALDDISDPLHPGQVLTYGQALADVATPIGIKRANAYAQAQGYTFQETAASYAARQYDEARGRLFARAAAAPDQLAFSPDAIAAFAAAHNHPMKPNEVVSADDLRQFFRPKLIATNSRN
jgi:hypothetical protein